MAHDFDEQSHEHSGLFPFQPFHDVELTPIFQVLSRGRGINSEVLFHYFTSGEKKVVTRYGSLKKNILLQEAEIIVQDLFQYHEELEKRNIPLPKIEHIKIEYDYHEQRALVLKTTEWTGTEVRHLIENALEKGDLKFVEKYVREMFRIIGRIVVDRYIGWETVVGIDPRCSNFTVDDQGKMWYVDLFPPRFRKNGVPLVEWPEPKSEHGKKLSHFKHFDVRGIILCMTAQLARINPKFKIFFEDIVFDEAQKVMTENEWKEFYDELKKSPWMKMRDLFEKQNHSSLSIEHYYEIIDSAVQEKIFGIEYSVYTLREIILELCLADIVSHEDVKNFFALSHFEDELPEAVIQLFLNHIKEHIKKLF